MVTMYRGNGLIVEVDGNDILVRNAADTACASLAAIQMGGGALARYDDHGGDIQLTERQMAWLESLSF